MGWPKGKKRGKRKLTDNHKQHLKIHSEMIKSFESKIEKDSAIIQKVSEARALIGTSHSKIWIDQSKVYFFDLLNEKIISFKLAE